MAAFWLSLGIGLVTTIGLIAFLSAQTFVGGIFWVHILKPTSSTPTERLGFGFVSGFILVVLVRQISLAFDLNEGILLVVVFLMLSTAPQLSRKESQRSLQVATQKDPETQTPIIAVALTAAFLGAREFISPLRYLVSIGLLLIPLWLLGRNNERLLHKQWARTSVVLLTFSSSFAINHAQLLGQWPNWKIRLFQTGSDDVIFSEAYAFLVDRNGLYPSGDGTTQWMYHWFSLAWTGSMSRVLELDPLIASVLVGPPIGYALITIFLVTILERRISSSFLPIWVVISIFFLSSPGARLTAVFVENTSNIFGLVLLFALVKVILDFESTWSPRALIRTLLIASLTSITALTKAPYMAALLIILLSQYAYMSRHGWNGRAKIALLDFLVASFSAVCTYWFFLREPNGVGSSYNLGLRSLVDYPDGLAAGLLLTLIWIAIRLTPLLLLADLDAPADIAIRSLNVGIPIAIAADILLDSNGDIYFTNAALAVASPGLALVFASLWRQVQGRTTSVVCIALVATTGIVLLARYQNLKLDNWKLAPAFAASLTIASITLVTATFALGRLRQSRPTSALRRPLVSSLAGVCLLLGLTGKTLQIGELPHRDSFPTSEETEAMNRIRTDTSGSSVIASNLGSCEKSRCISDDYRQLFISALARRQSIPSGAVPNDSNMGSATLLEHELVALFAAKPTTELLGQLRNLGATHFLLFKDDRQDPERDRGFETLKSRSDILDVFSNNQFVLFQLGLPTKP